MRACHSQPANHIAPIPDPAELLAQPSRHMDEGVYQAIRNGFKALSAKSDVAAKSFSEGVRRARHGSDKRNRGIEPQAARVRFRKPPSS